MTNDYTYKSWKKQLKELEPLMPNGLFERWAALEPVGVLQWGQSEHLNEQPDNTYNWIDKDAQNIVLQCGRLNQLWAVAFHLGGDVRGNYTDYYLFENDKDDLPLWGFSDEEWKELGGEVYD